MLGVALSVTRLQRRIRSHYQLSLFNPAVWLPAAIYLVVPSLLFWLPSMAGWGPGDIAVSLYFFGHLAPAQIARHAAIVAGCCASKARHSR